jgi:hypothetical protein
MYKFVIEYWFRRSWFEKDFEHTVIVAKNEKQAMDTLRKTVKRFFFAPKIISVTQVI